MFDKSVLMNTTRAFAVAAGLGGCVTMEADAKPKAAAPAEQGCKKIQSGKASWYGNEMAKKTVNGKRKFNATSSGVPFNPNANLVAHKTLPFHTPVIIKDESTGRQIKSSVLDRGPYADNRIVDLSKGAAEQLGIKNKGVAWVSLYRCPS